MDMKKNDKQAEESQDISPAEHGPRNAIEQFYERFRGIPLKRIDLFIGVCTAALILVVVLGMLKERGLL